jgi:uncharacterized membrane protein YecN with MAPEG domain
MLSLHTTLVTAALLGLVFVALSFNVVRLRAAKSIPVGDGNDPSLQLAIRMHANFSEYGPLTLILLGGIELFGAPHLLVLLLCLALIISRIAHPFGMPRPAPNLLRAGGMVLTWGTLLIASITALVLAF